jgi:hypothetical protein
MFLGRYEFAGDPADLLDGYRRLAEAVPTDAGDLHMCVVGDRGITVFDACPTREVFESFSTSDMFLGAISAAGLPAPTVVGVGDVYSARLREEVAP